MPFCVVENFAVEEFRKADVPRRKSHTVEIFYQLYGHGDTKVLLIPGVAANYEAWGPQLVDLCGTDVPNQEEGVGNGNGNQRDGHENEEGYAEEQAGVSGNGIQACAFDNRGVGRSSMPEDKKHYSTTIMAKDALGLMDHLGWERAHVVGHSMGGMIAMKLASIAPERVISLAMLSTTGGGYQCLPKLDRTMIKIAYRFMRARTPEERAHVDLDTHYTKDYLDTLVGDEYRRARLYKDYVKNLSTSGMQPKHGLDGQFHACWNHGVSSYELDSIRNARVRVVVIHGTGDIVAQVRHARKIAENLHPVSRMVEFPGGHMITHQYTKEVNEVLLAAIKDQFPLECRMIQNDSEYSDAPFARKGWKIWQRGEAADGKVASVLLGSRCVGFVVKILIRYWPQCLSLNGGAKQNLSTSDSWSHQQMKRCCVDEYLKNQHVLERAKLEHVPAKLAMKLAAESSRCLLSFSGISSTTIRIVGRCGIPKAPKLMFTAKYQPCFHLGFHFPSAPQSTEERESGISAEDGIRCVQVMEDSA